MTGSREEMGKNGEGPDIRSFQERHSCFCTLNLCFCPGFKRQNEKDFEQQKQVHYEFSAP